MYLLLLSYCLDFAIAAIVAPASPILPLLCAQLVVPCAFLPIAVLCELTTESGACRDQAAQDLLRVVCVCVDGVRCEQRREGERVRERVGVIISSLIKRENLVVIELTGLLTYLLHLSHLNQTRTCVRGLHRGSLCMFLGFCATEAGG